MNNQHTIDRRKFLKAIGASALLPLVSATAFSAAMSYARDMDSSKTSGQVFNQQQMLQLRKICELTIPETDTPGAHQVDTHGFIDNQLAECFSIQQQKAHVSLLAAIDKATRQKFNTSFLDASHDQQFEMLTNVDSGINGFSDKQKNQFRELKGLIAFGYFTSQVGMTQVLRYLPMPGGYDGSFSYQKGDGGWAS